MKKLLILLICLFLFACGGSDDHKPTGIEISYSVSSFTESCYDIAYVSYMVPGISYYNFKIRLPWSHSFYAQPGDFLYLSAIPDNMADPNCSSEYELNLAIKRGNAILEQGPTCANDPNTDRICESHEISSML